jgi:hypothetical protein
MMNRWKSVKKRVDYSFWGSCLQNADCCNWVFVGKT